MRTIKSDTEEIQVQVDDKGIFYHFKKAYYPHGDINDYSLLLMYSGKRGLEFTPQSCTCAG